MIVQLGMSALSYCIAANFQGVQFCRWSPNRENKTRKVSSIVQYTMGASACVHKINRKDWPSVKIEPRKKFPAIR